MPPEKRALDHDYARSSAHKRSRREDTPRDWRAAHLDGGRNSSRRDEDRYKDRSRERYRDHSRNSSQAALRTSSSTPHRERSPLAGSNSSKKDENARKSFSPTSKAPKQMSPDDEKEEGEISPHALVDTVMQDSTTAPPDEQEFDFGPKEQPKFEDDAEARRARRAAILAKYQAKATNSQGPAVAFTLSANPLERVASIASAAGSTPGQSTPSAMDTGAAPSPSLNIQEDGNFLLSKGKVGATDDHGIKLDDKELQNGGAEGVVAADYDPSQDMRDDVRKAAKLAHDVEELEAEGSEYEEEDADEIEDMFALGDEEEKKPKKKKRVVKKVTTIAPETMDTAADEEGYYQIILGESLDGGRYQVFALVGKGMFSNVVKARVFDPDGDKERPVGEVAIKIVRSQESMYKAGAKEAQILQKLRQGDPEDKKHLIRLERTFEHRGHLCLVFESLSMNLRDTIKKYGRDVGLHIKAVRVYAHQLFLALSHLRKSNILHADIKPDNILINESRSNLKLCDLGSATDISYETAEIAPYLVSRFYRAPEIILGLPYDCAVDVWSMGCTLYELFTGRILFPGRSNREMLKLMMELKGRFNQKLVKKARFGDVYFDEGGGFYEVLEGGGGDKNKKIHITKPVRDLRTRLQPTAPNPDDAAAVAEEKEVLALIDLLDKCLHLDPARRITPRDALVHPFIRGA